MVRLVGCRSSEPLRPCRRHDQLTIRGIDPLVWRRFRSAAVAQGTAAGPLSPPELELLNAEGWTYDIRWHDEEYLGNNYTRVEGHTLNAKQLREARSLAELWQRSPHA